MHYHNAHLWRDARLVALADHPLLRVARVARQVAGSYNGNVFFFCNNSIVSPYSSEPKATPTMSPF